MEYPGSGLKSGQLETRGTGNFLFDFNVLHSAPNKVWKTDLPGAIIAR